MERGEFEKELLREMSVSQYYLKFLDGFICQHCVNLKWVHGYWVCGHMGYLVDGVEGYLNPGLAGEITYCESYRNVMEKFYAMTGLSPAQGMTKEGEKALVQAVWESYENILKGGIGDE